MVVALVVSRDFEPETQLVGALFDIFNPFQSLTSTSTETERWIGDLWRGSLIPDFSLTNEMAAVRKMPEDNGRRAIGSTQRRRRRDERLQQKRLRVLSLLSTYGTYSLILLIS
jgi:hypothetical protein